jgi:hypothetical protein
MFKFVFSGGSLSLISLLVLVAMAPLLMAQTRPSARTDNGPIDRSAPQVKHRVEVGLEFDPRSAVTSSPERKLSGNIKIQIRISDHAPNADFFGVVSTEFTDFEAQPHGTPKVAWQDDACHSDRGLPKIAVVGITGRLENGTSATEISSQPRRTGQRVPADEISFTNAPDSLPKQADAAWTYRARTKKTGLIVSVRLVREICQP